MRNRIYLKLCRKYLGLKTVAFVVILLTNNAKADFTTTYGIALSSKDIVSAEVGIIICDSSENGNRSGLYLSNMTGLAGSQLQIGYGKGLSSPHGGTVGIFGYGIAGYDWNELLYSVQGKYIGIGIRANLILDFHLSLLNYIEEENGTRVAGTIGISVF